MGSEDVNPLASPATWDYIELGGRSSPGICKLSPLKRKNTWDVKKGKGTLGATITFVGRDPVEFTATLYFWLESHFDEWAVFRRALKFDPTKTAVTATTIYHPSLSDLELNSVVIESIGAITHEGKGLYSVEIAFLEYFPPPKRAATGTPSGSKANTKGSTPGTTPDPIADAQQAEIAKLLKQAGEP